MSKNVAVFVDVANIFYAAKAAGVDIDYVTLLKSATAGRDFVRAYAYTGLDPENENQRQFHAFLARSGYKVISKDIRKYGDGRIKANLDIELVVDLMKTARNLDIAVVVSGDGDFAPAIRAVQEMGVRCEVISFRGNTSSDLIDVADQFTDIAQIARVEKGSARSGRRVATEGDLSMTEVPEKETEGAPRRRRGSGRTRDERVPVAVVAEAEADAQAASLVALPGERLSRAPAAESESDAAATDELEEGDVADGAAVGEDARRRRRRRGGRGRGRGRREDGAVPVGEELVAVAGDGAASDEEVDEEEFEDLPPTQAPHHTFGSVWDSQLGVAPGSVPMAVESIGGVDGEDEQDLDEPEVPEYLLAERRQRGQRPVRGGRQPRGRSAYQAALDRERYGRGTPQPTFGGDAGRPDRGRDRGRGGRPQQSGRPQQGGGRPQRPPRAEQRPPMSEQRTSSEPWSEVPPELEELLRAEISRKQPAAPTAAQAPTIEPPTDVTADAPEAAKPTRRRRTTAKAGETAQAPETDSVLPAEGGNAAPAAPAKRVTRARTTKAATTKPRASKAAAAAPEASADEPKKPVRRRRTAAAEPASEEG